MNGSYARDTFNEWHLLALMDGLNVTDTNTPYVKWATSPQDAERRYKEMMRNE